jgi:hypothetical protein
MPVRNQRFLIALAFAAAMPLLFLPGKMRAAAGDTGIGLVEAYNLN